jgi:hypothetical protein
MKQWEVLEDYLFDIDAEGVEFTNRTLADRMGVSPAEASAYIQAYLSAQNAERPDTLFVLYRCRGRGPSSVWRVGVRAADARELFSQTRDDFRRRIERAVEPTMRSMGIHNSKALPAVNAIVQMFEAMIAVSALDGGAEAKRR